MISEFALKSFHRSKIIIILTQRINLLAHYLIRVELIIYLE